MSYLWKCEETNMEYDGLPKKHSKANQEENGLWHVALLEMLRLLINPFLVNGANFCVKQSPPRKRQKLEKPENLDGKYMHNWNQKFLLTY